MWGVAAPSLTGPAVVSTWVMRWGASSSQVSVTCTVYPTHDVVCLLPYRASTAYGELLNSPDGGIPSCSVRPCTYPDARSHGWTHTRRHVSTAGTSRHHAGAWEVSISDHKASPSAPMTCA